jgi:hypothetical protein
VRVHDDAAAHQAAKSLNARAFTHGSDIYLAANESAGDRRLMGHELTHVIQQAGGTGTIRDQASTHVVRRSNGDPQPEGTQSDDDEAFADSFIDELFDEIEELEESENCSDKTYGYRARLLMQFGNHMLPTNDDEADAYREWVFVTADSEDLTLDELGPTATDYFPYAFPETWAFWIYEALATEESLPMDLLVETSERFEDLASLAANLPNRLWEEGLPMTFEEARAGRPFYLSMSHARLEDEVAVKQYAEASIRYTRALWHMSFVFAWNDIAEQVADAIRDCTTVPDVPAYYDFLENYSEILATLPDRLSELRDPEGLQEIESGTLALADAALVAGLGAGLSAAIFGILSGWSNAQDLFEESLAGADELVASADDLDKFVRAIEWANRYGYFGDAGQEIVNAILEHGLYILGVTLGVIVAQFIPGVNVGVDVVLFIVSGRDLIETIDSLGSAISVVFDANSIQELQKASTQLATALVGDGLLALVDLILVMVSLRGARSRMQEIRRRNPQLSEEEALRQALRESDETGRALARASDFEAWEATLDSETRLALQRDPELRRLFATMDQRVRNLLTVCRSPCIPLNPRPRPEDVARIEGLIDRLDLPGNHRGLTEYLYHNRRRLSEAVEGFDDIENLGQLDEVLDASIRGYAAARGGSAARNADGLWEFTREDGTVILEHEVAQYGHLLDNRGTNHFFEAHHGAQDKWAIDVGMPGYSRREAPAILLRDRRKGSPHQIVTGRQMGRAGHRSSRTYQRERELTLEDLQRAECPPATIESYMTQQNAYFGRLYREASLTHSVEELRRWFGDWTPGGSQ